MKLNLLSVAVLMSLSFSPVSASFFPNITSIPPWLPTATAGAWDVFHNFTGCHSGEKVNGLFKLKKYFCRFGYIPDVGSNFTDDFDNALEAALRTYQKNFNLNVTGQLDDQTLQQIMRPRCGNADIVNGTTSMNSGKMSSARLHTTAHYSFFPGTPRWPDGKRDLTYAFFDNLAADVKSVFSRAFNRWAAVTPLTFTLVDSLVSADIRIGFFEGDHGDGQPFDGALGTLAHAFAPPAGRFHLDAAENWSVTDNGSTSAQSSAFDLESVAVHEIGHLLGLGHSSVKGSIMYPTISSGVRKVELAKDDVRGIQELYGRNINSNGTTTASAGETDAGENSAAHYGGGSRFFLGVLLAVGFGLLYL
ncbi:hypothetical protein SLA2020_142060 [Shorea laevis]